MWTIKTLRPSPPVVRKSQTLRSVALGGLLGVLGAGTLLMPSLLPPALADDEPMRTLVEAIEGPAATVIDGSAFVKPDWTVEPWVSSEAIEERVIRKIAFGRTEFVTVMTTATGTYSTDSLDSANVRYPGIHPTPRPGPALLAYWVGGGWVVVAPFAADSFVSVVPFDGGETLIGGHGTCVRIRSSIYC